MAFIHGDFLKPVVVSLLFPGHQRCEACTTTVHWSIRADLQGLRLGRELSQGTWGFNFSIPPPKKIIVFHDLLWMFIYIYVYILKRVRWVIIIVDDHPFCFCRCFPFWGKTWPALGSKQNPMIRTFRWPAGNDGPGTNSCNDLPSCDLCGGCTGITGTGSNGGG